MKVEIEIPKEFEDHFVCDHFRDSLMRLNLDAHELAGNYEQEMAKMLVKAFEDAKVLSEEKMQAVADKIPYINHFVKGELAVHIKNSEEYLGFITTLRKAGVEISNPADYPLNSGFYDPHYPFFYIHQGYQENSKDIYMNAYADFKKLCKRTDTLITSCIDYDEFIGGYLRGVDASISPDMKHFTDTNQLAGTINEYLDTEPNPDDRAGVIAGLLHGKKLEDLIDMNKESDDLER